MKIIALITICACVALNDAKPADKADDLPDLRAYLNSLSEDERNTLTRIIGGEEADAGEWPWLVSLKGDIPTLTFFGIVLSSAEIYCGASLLNDQWILTAAHCFVHDDLGNEAEDASNWEARMGDIDLETGILESIFNFFGSFFDDDDDVGIWEITGKSIHIHPDYDSADYWENDIALMKLKERVPQGSSNIQAVTLPNQGDYSFPEDGAMCVMKGWGCTEHGGSISEVAMELEMPKVSDNICASTWGLRETQTRLCAGYNLQDMGICSGDSGGPLVSRNENGVYEQVGIASFTSASAPGDWPGVFTRVANYVTWINTIIGNN